MTRLLLALPLLATACADPGVNRAVVQGQLFCSKASATGPVVVALANAAGVPVTVTAKSEAAVAIACAAIGAFPVLPPPVPGQAPVVAAVIPGAPA